MNIRSTKAATSARWLEDIELASRLIMPKILVRERELNTKKWFDYRFMSPLSATMLFARLFRAGYKSYIRMHVDHLLAENVNGVSTLVPEKANSDFTQLWQARQKADALGVPYDLVINFGFEFAGRRRRTNPPRPIQLFANRKTELAWHAEFEKYRDQHLSAAIESLSTPQFRLEHDHGLPAQREFRAVVLEFIRSSTKPLSIHVGRQCIQRRHLAMESVLGLAPIERQEGILSDVRRNRDLGFLDPLPEEKLDPIAFAPGCLGLPAAHDPCSNECTACPLLEQCGRVQELMARGLNRKFGTISPVAQSRLDNSREKTRIRVQNHRKKKAAVIDALLVAVRESPGAACNAAPNPLI